MQLCGLMNEYTILIRVCFTFILVLLSSDSFSEDIYFMTGSKPNIYWKACWMVISPLMLAVVLVAYVIVQAEKHPTYPAWDPSYVSKLCVPSREC